VVADLRDGDEETSMTNPRRDSGSDSASPPRMPRWVKVAAVIAGLLLLAFLVLRFTGIAGEHGPSRHSSANAAAPPVGTQHQAATRGDR
jgi:hypothetical protein